MITKDELPICPVTTAIGLIGNKWRLHILRLLFNDSYRFNVLLKSIPGISPKVLTDNLRFLEANSLVNRKVYSEIPLHVEYSLSDFGEELRPIIAAVRSFGIKYCTLKHKKITELPLPNKKA
ncbi:winged helix-turn-helix transcriptional regulator [Pectinatus haikarae]|uniref:DNA-binding HxlR family transcriptional regulator n=1 Tax=Pectinatus haikarae TaxID=349096 RepID=A0ABT9Y536_9FIRM|nr:helix-turn-helix domain-containing protein [Pectinatus haikarae]MDQ0202620.1 DNA-binding HxlR family transcriptional regulator [Pectinatus haikarae]